MSWKQFLCSVSLLAMLVIGIWADFADLHGLRLWAAFLAMILVAGCSLAFILANNEEFNPPREGSPDGLEDHNGPPSNQPS
jgi:hypothetical protein